MDPLTIAIFAGAGLKAYGQYQSAQSQAWAARQNAKMKETQAREMLERMGIQEDRMKQQGEEFKSKQAGDFARGGVQLGTGATLVTMEDTNFKIAQGIDDMRRDTVFRVNQLQQGASFEYKQAGETADAGAILAGGSLLEGAGSYYKNVV
jgi:hypothetical protein